MNKNYLNSHILFVYIVFVIDSRCFVFYNRRKKREGFLVRHVFIVNPAAGKGKKSLQIADSVHAFFRQRRPGKEYQVYQTSGPADAERAAPHRAAA